MEKEQMSNPLKGGSRSLGVSGPRALPSMLPVPTAPPKSIRLFPKGVVSAVHDRKITASGRAQKVLLMKKGWKVIILKSKPGNERYIGKTGTVTRVWTRKNKDWCKVIFKGEKRAINFLCNFCKRDISRRARRVSARSVASVSDSGEDSAISTHARVILIRASSPELKNAQGRLATVVSINADRCCIKLFTGGRFDVPLSDCKLASRAQWRDLVFERRVSLPEHLESQMLADHADVEVDEEGDPLRVNQYRLEKKLGSGAFGSVHMATDITTGSRVALKLMNKQLFRNQMYRGEYILPKVRAGLEAVIKTRSSPNVLAVLRVIEDQLNPTLFVALEFCAHGSVMERGTGCKYIVQPRHRPAAEQLCFGGLPTHLARLFTRDMVAGLEYMHRFNITHGDIKPENLLVDSKNCVKIADFGCVARHDPKSETRSHGASQGTLHFLSPEAVKGGNNDPYAQDVWAAAMSTFCMVYGKLPFSEESEQGLFTRICKEQVCAPRSTPTLRRLFKRMLALDTKSRGTLADLADDPWLDEDSDNESDGDESVEFVPSDDDDESVPDAKYEVNMSSDTAAVDSAELSRRLTDDFFGDEVDAPDSIKDNVTSGQTGCADQSGSSPTAPPSQAPGQILEDDDDDNSEQFVCAFRGVRMSASGNSGSSSTRRLSQVTEDEFAVPDDLDIDDI